MRRAYAIMSGQLSPSGILKELLAGTHRVKNGTLGGGGEEGCRKAERGGEARRENN